MVYMARFNTQPPEGGCARPDGGGRRTSGFNTQPPEGGCKGYGFPILCGFVSTHSRLKAAAAAYIAAAHHYGVSTHSRLKAAAEVTVNFMAVGRWFQHTAA